MPDRLIDTAEDMERALAKMDDDQRAHLKLLISSLIQCYINDDTHGLVLIGTGQYNPLKLIAVNATEMDAAALMAAASEFIHCSVMEDAPPKEKFN